MAILSRRCFLSAAAALPVVVATAKPDDAGSTVCGEAQRYGTFSGRIGFRDFWRDWSTHLFEHQDYPTFHRCRTSLDAHYSRCQQPIARLDERPVCLQIKLLCAGEAGRTLFTVGLKSISLGSWAFSLGACPTQGISFGVAGWQISVNAANPNNERTPVIGLDQRDWHTFSLRISQVQGPAQLYCDGRHVMDLRQPITAIQREKVAASQNGRHGSIQQLVPETPEEGDYVFIESRHPGQILDIDSFQVSQFPLTTRRKSLPVLLELDWETNGTYQVENSLTRFQGNPVLNKANIPDPSGKKWGGMAASVIREETGFRMYFAGVNQMSQEIGRLTFGLYHAFSRNGMDWEVIPRKPVLNPGDPGAWDAGSLGQAVVRKEKGRYRMWYGGYISRLQQGRAGYAESRDGIHWAKPNLGLVRFSGEPTNICFSLQPGLNSNEYQLPVDIVRDNEAPPERRYVMFLHTQGPHGFIVDVATSSDGRKFLRAPHNARHYAFDKVPRNSTLHGAAVVLHEPNYWWAFVGHHEAEEKGYRMRFTGWRVDSEEQDNISFGLWNSQRTHLEPDLQSWDRGNIHISSFLEVGNEWWVYYSCEGSFGLAKVGRHRMLGLQLESGRSSGQVISIGFWPSKKGWRHHKLTVNVSGLSRGGFLEAELLSGREQKPLSGFTLGESIAIQEDSYDAPLHWDNARAGLPDTQQPLRVRLKITRGNGNPQIHAIYVRDR